MSYILDALNKSDQERRASQTPSLNTMHQPPVAGQSSNRWLIILLVIAAINGGGFWYWINHSPSEQEVSQNSVPEPAPEPVPMKSTNDRQPSSTQAPRAENIEPTAKPIASLASDSELQLAAGEILISPPSMRPVLNNQQQAITEWVSIGELPVNVQRQIPDLEISSHLYSDDPELRLVNINGKMISEGESISPGFRLVMITEDGAVINFRHYNFEVSVLRDWHFN